MLTGKCKDEFEKWYLDNHWLPSSPYYIDFESLTEAMQYGVYVDFFNSVGIYPVIVNEAYKDGVNTLWQVFIYDPGNYDNWSNKSSGLYGDNGDYDLEQAREAAISYSNDIYNEL